MKPSLTEVAGALRTTDVRFPWVGPTAEEAEIADLLEEIEALHVSGRDEPDARGGYGRCSGCRETWPCQAWVYGEQLAVQYLGRAADRVYAHARPVMDRIAEREKAHREGIVV